MKHFLINNCQRLFGSGFTAVLLVAVGGATAAEACYRCTLVGSTVGCDGSWFSGGANCTVRSTPSGSSCTVYGGGCS